MWQPTEQHPDEPHHLATCARCQARLTLDGLDVDLDSAWTAVAATILAPPIGPIERVAARLLRSPGLARALVTTPSLLLSWIIARILIMVIGILATHSTNIPWALLLAPALAGISIAYAYGPGVDPAFELSQTMAISDRLVLLVRSLAVFGLNAGLGLIASCFTSDLLGLTFLWLVPMTAVAALALATSTLTRSANVGVTVALGCWCIVVLGARTNTGDFAAAVTHAGLMPGYLAVTVVSLLLARYAISGQRTGGMRWQP